MVPPPPKNFVNNFWDLSEAFVGHYLCSAHHKQNISTLQNIKMRENKSLKDFMKRFRQVVLQVSPIAWTPFYRFSRETSVQVRYSLSLLQKSHQQRWTTYSNEQTSIVCSKTTSAWLTQQVLVTNRPTTKDHVGSSKPSNQLRQTNKGQDDQ